jgi:hypothetical protein
VNVKDLWYRLRTGVVLEVTWDLAPHGSIVGAQWRILRKTAGAAYGTILPSKAPFRFDRYKASDVRIDGPDTYTVLEKGTPIRTFRINESGARSLIFTATDLLRAVLKNVDGDVAQAREALRKSDHPETRSAARILHRDSTRMKGATHVRYVGNGSFRAEEPHYFVERIEYDKTIRRIGPWDTEAYGPLDLTSIGYWSRALNEARRVIAPDAYMLRVVNHAGHVVATSPSMYCADGSPVREDWERRSA